MKKIVHILLLLISFNKLVQAQQEPDFWKEITAFKANDSILPAPRNAILFVGSSSFRKWTDIKDYFPGYTIINRGFGGSTLVDVIRYAYNIIIPYYPRQVIIYCGENDLASPDSVSVHEVVTRFKTLFGMIRVNLPDAVIDFVSIKPSPSRVKIIPKIKETNRQIKRFLLGQRKASFINIYPSMLDGKGLIRDDLFLEDRLHMKPEGYHLWQKIIKPYLLH